MAAHRCPKKALKIGLSVSFILTALLTYVMPDSGLIILAVGAGQNLFWLWEV